MGYKVNGDEIGIFGNDTYLVLTRFQADRNLKIDGKCTADTWRHLTEATWKLGDRLLYLRKPMLRGDDVAKLQISLSNLGFSSGKIDGIFGPQTLEAVIDFQQNQHINNDGMVGPNTLRALNRVTRPDTSQVTCIDNLKEFIEFKSKIRSIPNLKIGIGDMGGSDVLVHLLNKKLGAFNLNTDVLTGLNERGIVTQANNSNYDLCIFFQYDELIYSFNVYHYKGFSYESMPGLGLGNLITEKLSALNLCSESGNSLGCSFPILRETRMPTLLIELGTPIIKPANSYLIVDSVFSAIAEYISAK